MGFFRQSLGCRSEHLTAHFLGTTYLFSHVSSWMSTKGKTLPDFRSSHGSKVRIGETDLHRLDSIVKRASAIMKATADKEIYRPRQPGTHAALRRAS